MICACENYLTMKYGVINVKDIVFDGCTEVLLRDIIDSSPEKDSDMETAYRQLPEFQIVCENQELCPKG